MKNKFIQYKEPDEQLQKAALLINIRFGTDIEEMLAKLRAENELKPEPPKNES